MRAYIIPLRNDLNGLGLFVGDLLPRSSQKNSVLDGEGQTHYIRHSFDAEADDQIVNLAEGLVKGSATTDTITDLQAANVVAPGGDDSGLTQQTAFGLKAYLRERVHVNPDGDDDYLVQAELNNLYDDIVARVNAGGDLNLSYINSRLVARSGDDTELGGGDSDSFGSVEDILRILSGEVYRTPYNTIVDDGTGTFMSLAVRQSRVANSIYAETVYAQGGFLTPSEVGYRTKPKLALTGAVRLSARSGILSKCATNIKATNPLFRYAGSTPSAVLEQAVNPFTKTLLPASGVAPICYVYGADGVRLE